MPRGDASRFGPPENRKAGAFRKGDDPRRNAGGRPKIAKAWELAVGKTTGEVAAEALKLVWDVFIAGPGTSGKTSDPNDPNWRFAAQKVLEYSAGKPKETVEVIENEPKPRRIEWAAMTLDRRREVLAAIRAIREASVEPEVDDAGTTEH